MLIEAHEAAAPEGPKSPNAGPVFPSKEMDTDKTSSMSRFGSRKEIVSIDAVTKTNHELTIPRIIQTLSSSTTERLNLIATILLGWIIFITSLLANSKAIRILRTFRPPPVEPALAPMIISSSKTNWLNTGHSEKLALEKPVLVIEIAWKMECRTCLLYTSDAADE